MFKKIFTLSILYIWLLWSTDAFLWDEAWLDLYKDIEEGIEDLQLKNFEYELSWWWNSISEEVNDILVINWMKWCLDDNLNSSDIKDIASWNISALHIVLKNEQWCLPETGLSIKSINDMMNIIKDDNIRYNRSEEHSVGKDGRYILSR